MKQTDPVSLIITVKNEALNILALLKSIQSQTLGPNQVVIVDGGSSDQTVAIIKSFIKQQSSLKSKSSQPKYQLLIKELNRSQGRNLAIERADHELIAMTDAGCTLDKNWLKELIETKQKMGTPVVAGYYQGLAKSPFTQAVIPYFLVMPGRVNPQNFLPATRSMLIEKSLWRAVGGFREDLDVSEDYDFSQRVKSYLDSKSESRTKSKAKFKIAFTAQAIVIWQPPDNLVHFLATVVNMAVGDARANLIRTKVKLIFGRYLLAFSLLSLWLETCQSYFGISLMLATFVYISWSIFKNWRWAQTGWYWLPVLQITSDIMIMGGTVLGWLDSRQNRKKVEI